MKRFTKLYFILSVGLFLFSCKSVELANNPEGDYLKIPLDNPNDILQLRLCKGNGVLLSSDYDGELNPSQLQTLSFFICPCRDTSRFNHGFMYDDSKAEGLNQVSNLTKRSSNDILKQEAVSTVYIVLNGLSDTSVESGVGMMIYPRKPIYFGTNWLSKHHYHPNAFDRGGNWFRNIINTTPMNVVFGDTTFDFYWVTKAYPIIWHRLETMEVHADKQIFFSSRDLHDIMLDNLKQQNQHLHKIKLRVVTDHSLLEGIDLTQKEMVWDAFEKKNAGSDIALAVRKRMLVEMIVSEERGKGKKENVYHIPWISHSSLESGSVSKQPVFIATDMHLNLPLYPNVEPYFINIDEPEQQFRIGHGIRLVTQDPRESFRYARYKIEDNGEMKFISGQTNIKEVYLKPKDKKKIGKLIIAKKN